MKEQKKRILIGSSGGLTGIYLARQYAKSGEFFIIGADCSEITAGKMFIDKQCYLPRADAPDFIESLIELLDKEDVDYYLPTHSKEIRRVAMCENELKKRARAKFIVSPAETFEALDSKESLYYSLASAQITTPAMITGENKDYPVVMKGKIGSGGSGVLRIDNSEIYNAFRKTNSDVCFFEYINGKEYTADCVFDSAGRLIACNSRERVKTIGGAVVISRNTAEFEILPWIKKLEKKWKFCGCVNFQYIVRDNTPYFTDINLRYPSGGLPLTVESGINVPEIIIRLLNGDNVLSEEYQINPKVRTMFRYYNEVFEYDAD